jgi:ABC-2 type transport system permease protein
MNGRKVYAIAKKEIGYYFSSPVGYIVLTAFFLATGYFFWLIMRSRQASMAPVFQNTIVILLFLSPGITMRLWSEEEKNGTAELLKTSPLTLWEIVLGKYLGACGFFGAMLIPTFIYLFLIGAIGNPDYGIVLANYLGYVLAAVAFFSVGLLVSTMTENQIVSMVVTWVVLLLFWVIGAAGDAAQGQLGDFLKEISIYEHLDDFFKGVIGLSHVVYFASMIFLGLFFSVKILESKRN